VPKGSGEDAQGLPITTPRGAGHHPEGSGEGAQGVPMTTLRGTDHHL